jgi:hypothetical protein
MEEVNMLVRAVIRGILGAVCGAMIGLICEAFIRVGMEDGAGEYPILGVILGSTLGCVVGLTAGYQSIPQKRLPVISGLVIGLLVGVASSVIVGRVQGLRQEDEVTRRKTDIYWRGKAMVWSVPMGAVLGGVIGFLLPVARARVAQRELMDLQTEYTMETALEPDLTRCRPAGVNNDAGFDSQTGQIFVYDDVPPDLRNRYLAEELYHYRQVRDAGYLGKTFQEIQQIDSGFPARIEHETSAQLRRLGFFPSDSRSPRRDSAIPGPPAISGD